MGKHDGEVIPTGKGGTVTFRDIMASRNVVTFAGTHYLGSLPSAPNPRGGTLELHPDGTITHGRRGVEIHADSVSGVELDSAAVAKSRAGAFLLLGVGGFIAKNKKVESVLTFHLADKTDAIFAIEIDPGKVRAKVTPWMARQRLGWGTPQSANTTPGHPLANELAKLAVLHENGILTAEEFAQAKAKLLG